jgi:transcriptional regulator with XRE-family HTH domain
VGERFADRLQRLRQVAGLTQLQLAEAARNPVSSLRNWEQGRRLPQLDAAVLLAEALGVTLDELAGKADDMRPVEEPEPKRPGRPGKAVGAEALDAGIGKVKGKRKGGA